MTPLKRLSAIALLSSAALMAGWLESMFPLPFPGMRLGLANIFIIIALLLMGARAAVSVALLRLSLSFFLSGNPAALSCSAGGLALSLPTLIILRAFFPATLSVPAISTASAFAFNLGQLSAVAAMTGTPGVFAYLPPLWAAAAVTGYAVGRAADAASARIAGAMKY
jgi:heptaprenyl diphosphate synthase